MYKFRLTIFHGVPGFFGLDSAAVGFRLNEDIGLEVYPRDSAELGTAKKYHIDCGGFESKEEALGAGENLRKKLRLINSILGLGLLIPVNDSVTGKVSDALKKQIGFQDCVLLDSRVGLSSFPDDGLHLEVIASGEMRVIPSSPMFLLEEVKKIWDTEFYLDEKVEEVLELLSISSREQSPKLKFLTTYLALELMLVIKERSIVAQTLVSSFIDQVNKSFISEGDKQSLIGALSNLKRVAFTSAFKSFSRTILEPKDIQGMSPEELASRCIKLRNKIAHKAEIKSDVDINGLTRRLRELVLRLVWTKYGLPEISVNRPADSVVSDKFSIKLM